jgi:hypothetical protein
VICRTTRDPSVGACCRISDRRLLGFFYKEYNWSLASELVPRRMARVAGSFATWLRMMIDFEKFGFFARGWEQVQGDEVCPDRGELFVW